MKLGAKVYDATAAPKIFLFSIKISAYINWKLETEN